MGIKGDLTTINLADIFQTLSVNQKTGILNISFAQKSKKIFLKEGEILSISLGNADWAFGDFLLRQNIIPKEEFDAICEKRERDPDLSFEKIIVEQGYFSYGQLEELMTLQITEEIYDLFTWDGGEFDFDEDDSFLKDRESKVDSDTHIFINTSGLILEAARRADEWERFKKLIKSSKDIFKKGMPKHDAPVTLDGYEITIYENIDGKKDVSEMALTVSIGIFDVYSSLFKLLKTGMIRPLDIQEMLLVGKEALESENYAKAVKVFERINELEEDEPLYIKPYAEALVKFGNLRVAVIQYILLATILSVQKKTNEAIECYRKVLELIPEDTMARERLASIFETENRKAEATEQYRTLAELYFKNKAYYDCQTALRSLLAMEEDDLEARKMLAEVLISSGEKDEGILEYEIVAGKLYAQMDEASLVEALAIYKKIVEESDGSPELRMELANIYTQLGQQEQAIREFDAIAKIYENMADTLRDGSTNTDKWELLIDVYRQILDIDPENIEAKENIANALMNLGTSEEATAQFKDLAEELRERGDIVRSTEFLQKVTSLEPTDLSSRFELASNLMSKGKFDEAILEYKGIAVAAKKNNDLDQAEDAYNRIRELNPFEVNAQKGLAEIFYRRGEIEKAVEQYNSLAMICYGAKLYEAALGSYSVIHNLMPNNKEIIRKMADVNLKLGNENDAAESLSALASLYERESDYYEVLVIYRDILKFRKDTVEYFEKAFEAAIKLNSDKDIISYGKQLASLYEQTEEIEKAVEIYEMIHTKVPGEIQVLSDYANILEKQGNIGKACRFYREISRFYLQNDLLPQAQNIIEKAEKLMPEDGKIQLVTALLAAKTGNLDEAETRFRKSVELDPENIVALKGYGDILVRKDQKDQAVEFYHKAFATLEKQNQFEDMIKIQEAILLIRPDDVDEKIRIAEVYEMLGNEIKVNVYVSEAARKALEEGDKERAYGYFRKFLERNSQLDNVRRALFNLALDQGDKDLAASEGIKLVRHCMERLDYENAKVLVEYILKFSPENSIVHIEKDKIAFEMGNEEQGLEGLKQTIMALRSEGNYFRLKRHLRDIQKYIPKNPGVHETLGAVHAKEGSFEEAVDEYRIALSLLEEAGNEKGAAACRTIIQKLNARVEGKEDTQTLYTHESVKKAFTEYDESEDREAAGRNLWDVLEANTLSESNLSLIEEQAIQRGIRDLACEAERRLIKLFLMRDVFTRAKEIFEANASEFSKDTEILDLLASAAERKGDETFARSCLNKLFRYYDSTGNSEYAVSICSRILLLEPYNKQAVGYVKDFAVSKERFYSEESQESAPALTGVVSRTEVADPSDADKKEQSQKLFRECQQRIKQKSPGLQNFKDIQKRFINAMTEESLGHYDESIRIFQDLIEAL